MINLYPFCSPAQDLVSMIYYALLLLPFWYVFPSLNIRVSLKGCTGKKRSPSIKEGEALREAHRAKLGRTGCGPGRTFAALLLVAPSGGSL